LFDDGFLPDDLDRNGAPQRGDAFEVIGDRAFVEGVGFGHGQDPGVKLSV
jgi:hypothetical protein